MTRGRPLVALSLAAVTLALVLLAAGEILSHPANRPVGPSPPDFPAHSVSIPTAEGGALVGWLWPGLPGHGAVLLLHGNRSDRRQMLARARFLGRNGYATLAVDQQAHGESPGTRITFGAREAEGVRASLAFLRRELPGEPIAVIGVSLGAAATVLAHPKPPPAAVVLESLYPTIEQAVANRLAMRFGAGGDLLAPLLLWQLRLVTGVAQRDLHPIAAIADLAAPVLIASGSEDRHTPWAETERIFAAASAPKELWRVAGAAHVDLHGFAPAEYEARILEFLARNLRPAARAPQAGTAE